MRIVFHSEFDEIEAWRRVLAVHCPWARIEASDEIADPAGVEAALVYRPPPDFFAGYPDLRLVQSFAAGIDDLVAREDLPKHVALLRMVDDELTRTMAEYVLWAVLHLHRGMPGFARDQRSHRWDYRIAPARETRRVGILGLGTLGSAAATRLLDQDFPVSGWTRSEARSVDSRISRFVGTDGLDAMLVRTDILICLLPLTGQTRAILDAVLLAKLPRGAMLVQVGRGGHLVEPDLLAALDSGQISDAILDVFAKEPPAPDHPFWNHPRVLMTPHVASHTTPETAVIHVAAALSRLRLGHAPVNSVDRTAGY